MAFADFSGQEEAVRLLQRSLERGRLGHAYLFGGSDLAELEGVARTVAKTLNCLEPPRRSAGGMPLDSCDRCSSCRKIDDQTHPDILAVRPESKTRVITIDQMRGMMQTVHLKPTQAVYKAALIVGADRLNEQAANAFLKTLEEPPPNSILFLLTTQPERLLETIVSRCLRLSFQGESGRLRVASHLEWLGRFAEVAGGDAGGLLNRYRLLGLLVEQLQVLREEAASVLRAQSPLERYEELEPRLREKWEEELEAAIESEYRLRRTELLSGVQWWFRDIWLERLGLGGDSLTYPELAPATRAIAGRVTEEGALGNLTVLEELQRLLMTNVQEALALEVHLLRLKL